MAGTPAEHETTPAGHETSPDEPGASGDGPGISPDGPGTAPDGDAERAGRAADRAHALRTMFPRRVAAVPETAPAPGASPGPDSSPGTGQPSSAGRALGQSAGLSWPHSSAPRQSSSRPGPLGESRPGPDSSSHPGAAAGLGIFGSSPDWAAEGTAVAGDVPPVPTRSLKKRRTWVIVGTGVALIVAASAAVLVATKAGPEPAARDDVPAGVVVPALTPPAAQPTDATATPAPSESTSAGPSASASVSPSPGTSTPAPGQTAQPAPTGPPADGNPGGVNLALGRNVSVSGVEGDPWKASNAVDGDLTTRWSSAFADPGWLIVDLGRSRSISEVEIAWEHAYATSYRVETSADGKKWVPIFSTTGGAGGTVTVRQAATGRYVRLYCLKRNSQYGYSVLELRVR